MTFSYSVSLMDLRLCGQCRSFTDGVAGSIPVGRLKKRINASLWFD